MNLLISVLSIALLLLGCPIYIVLLGASMYGFYALDIPLINLVIQFEKLQEQDFITAIPLFTFAGYVLSNSKSPERILKLLKIIFQYSPSVQNVLVISSLAFFTALTGASGVAILALGGVMLPMLIKNNYSDKFALGLIMSSSSVGLLFMPSLPIIIYAIIASQNLVHTIIEIEFLFKSALLPFFVLIGIFTLHSFLVNRKITKKVRSTVRWRDFWHSVANAKYELPLPIFIYSFVYLGIFTILETSFVTAVYSCVVVFFIKKDLKIRQELIAIVISSLKLSGAIFMVMVGSLAFKEIFVQAMLPEKIFTIISPYIQNKYVFLIVINVFLLAVGAFLDIFSAILIILPILLPIVESYDINPYHFAIIFLLNLEIGYLTPPMGMNLFIASYRFKKPIVALYRASVPFLLWMLGVLVVFTYIPILSTFSLPKKAEVSNTSSSQVNDRIAPARIETLSLIEAGIDYLVIGFLASGDDNKKGTAASYLIGYSKNNIASIEDFEFEATTYVDKKKPQTANTPETIRIDKLKSATTYYIAIIVVDNAGNKSTLSSVLKEKTL